MAHLTTYYSTCKSHEIKKMKYFDFPYIRYTFAPGFLKEIMSNLLIH
jgi:hypothetical protein